jgi:hypothetical protein
MAQSVPQPQPLSLLDDAAVQGLFSDTCVGVSVVNGNIHMTFATITADYGHDPARSTRRISARLIVPIGGALELRDLLTQTIDALTTQGVIRPPLSPTDAGNTRSS